MDLHLVSYYIGIAILFITSGFIIITNKNVLGMTDRNQGMILLLSAVLIAYWFTYTQGYIKF